MTNDSDRISAARTRVEASGGSWGWPRRLDDEQQAKALQLQKDGCSLTEIAAAVSAPRSTVQRALARG